MKRVFGIIMTLAVLAGCAEQDMGEKLDLGDFVLGHNIVVSPDPQKGPTSRDATPDELIAAVKKEIDTRLGRYEGDRLVHLGVNIGAYMLARPGIPLVYTPKSAFVLTVTAWDDRAGAKFHEKEKQIIALENLGNAPIIGSGHVNTREEQIEALAKNSARLIEKWLAENAVCMTDSATADQLAACWKDKEKDEFED